MVLKDAIYGLAVGDAFGVPYEFHSRGSFVPSDDMIGYGSHDVPAGTFSDDTSMTLATCDSIRARGGRIDTKDMRQRFGHWLFCGEYAVDHHVFDVGNTVATALNEGIGCTSEWSNGNGSLMRIIPLAFTDASDDEIREVSAITHGHKTSMDACARFVEIVRRLIDGGELYAVIDSYEPEVDTMSIDSVKSDGYVMDTYTAALWCLRHTDNYKDAVMLAVQLGDDTDTTAAVVGGVAGVYYGIESIPDQWMETLRGKDIIEKVLF